MRACEVADCVRPVKCRGYCNAHYQRFRAGKPMDAPVRTVMRGYSVEERFWARVEKAADGCWNWTAALDTAGYGRLAGADGPLLLTHRFSYELHVGPIPAGLHLDHLCRNPRCCNPAHLEPVTAGENVRRGVSPMADNSRKTHCVNGHLFDEANTYRWRGRRSCRACWADRRRNREAPAPTDPNKGD